MFFDIETLRLLKKYTKLDPKSYMRIIDEQNAAIEIQELINRVENCHLGVDFTKAYQLEANLRFMILKRKLLDSWLENFHKTNDLDQFALDYLYKLEEKEQAKALKKSK